MAINEKWAKWTHLSVSKHLIDQAVADSESIVVEFANQITPSWESAATQFEATIANLNFLERSKDSYLLSVSVFAIISSLRNNGAEHIEGVGKCQKWLNQCIRVLDYGDTGTVELCTLKVVSGTDGTLDTTNLKPAQTDDRLHSTIAVSYSARFKA